MSMFDLTSENGYGLNRVEPDERALSRLSAMARNGEGTIKMIGSTRNERTTQPVLTSRDDVKKSVSAVLKRVDILIRKGDLDQAEICVVQAREIDPKNIYAYAFEERIQILKEQAHKNAIAASMGKLSEEKSSNETKQMQVAATPFQNILIASQSVPRSATQKAQRPKEHEEGTSPAVHIRMNQFNDEPKIIEAHLSTQGICTKRGGETHVSMEDQTSGDRNLTIQRIIKIALDAARKEEEQKQRKIRDKEREEFLHSEQLAISEAQEVARQAEEYRQTEIRRKAEDELVRKFQERQEFNRMGQAKDLSVNVPEASERAAMQSQDQMSTNPSRRETLSRYKFVLLSAWADGAVTAEEGATLSELRQSLSISHEEHMRIEQEVKRETYIEAFKKAWNSGTISPENASVIGELRERFSITREEHLKIESTLLWEIQPVKNRPTLLVVDDDERLLNVVSETLNHAGFITKSVTTSDEAYLSLREAPPDLILCDVNLETSTMGGFAFYEKVREIEQLRETPFIFLSGLSDEALVRAGKEMGVDDYLSKPVSEETLVATINGKLRRYHELKKRRN